MGPTSTMVKRSLKYAGPLGLALWLMGCVFINRTSPKGVRALNAAGRRAKEQGTSLFLFPEGTRNPKRDLSLLEFKKGGFHVALDAGMPILPVVVSQYDFFDIRTRRFECGGAVVKVLRPIETDGYDKENMADLIKLTRDTMTKELVAISRGEDSKKSQ